MKTSRCCFFATTQLRSIKLRNRLILSYKFVIQKKMKLAERLPLYIQLTRLHRPIGILLLLWPTLWGLWIAGEGHPAWHIVLIFTLGTALMRSAGCAVNDYADRHIDKHVERTRERPLTSGKVSERETRGPPAGRAFAPFLLLLPPNPLTWLLSFPAVFLAASYPFTKRFFFIPLRLLLLTFFVLLT